MSFIAFTASFAFLVSSPALPVAETVTTCQEIRDVKSGKLPSARQFDLTGTLLRLPTPDYETVILEDETGLETVEFDTRLPINFAVGDRIRAHGSIDFYGQNSAYFECTNIQVLSHGTPPVIPTLKAGELFDEKHNGRPVRISGIVQDVFQDEIDPQFVKYEILSDGATVYAMSRSAKIPHPIPYDLLGAKVEICGAFFNNCAKSHPYSGRDFVCGASDIRILSRFENPFDAPQLDSCHRFTHPSEVTRLGRRRLCGHVLAAWSGNNVLVRTGDKRISRIVMTRPELPHPGEFIEAVGFVETDIYSLNLSRAHWRETREWADTVPPPTNVSARAITNDNAGNLRYDPSYHGRTVCLRGTVINLAQGEQDRFILECDEVLVPVEACVASGCLAPSIGDRVKVTGVCVLDAENWRPNAPLPRIRGFSIVLTSPDGLQIVERAPWWTLRRLLGLVGILLTGLSVVLLWNRALARKSDRRGRELAAEQIAHASSEIKVMERTRLAVELHDSVAQNLAGIALELQTAQALAERDPAATRTHLDIAGKSLRSCRSEIRNCLMDLRSDALDLDDMNEAIRRTLAAFPESIHVRIRFNVPRTDISDNTAHALLRIIRELTSNAVRHGHATEILIAGAIEGGQLLFSVRDNGCGFDPGSHPGVREGHYGLQGIRERINTFAGQLEIASEPGRGTKVTIAIQLPKESNAA